MYRGHPLAAMHRGNGWTPDPTALLRAADQVMRARWPTLQPTFDFNGCPMRCQFVYPGELRVHCGSTGYLFARSKPGKPTTPAILPTRPRVFPGVTG